MTHNSAPKLNGAGTLEDRVVSALQDPAITAADLAKLIAEASQGQIDAGIIAERLHGIAADPLQSSDAAKAQAAAELAALVVKRLENVIPRLRQKRAAAVSQQRRLKWNEAADLMQTNRDFLAAEFAECVPQWTHKLLELFQRVYVMNAEIENLNGLASGSESRRLESLGYQHLLATTKLLALTGEALWPPPQPPILPEQVMQVPPHQRDWHQAIEQRNRERYAESQRVANFYANRAREREDRENAEARAARNGAAP